MTRYSSEKSRMVKNITPHCDDTLKPSEAKKVKPSPHCVGCDTQVYGKQDPSPPICDNRMIISEAKTASD